MSAASQEQDRQTIIAQGGASDLLPSPAQQPTQPPAQPADPPIAAHQSERISSHGESKLRAYFTGVEVSQAELTFEYVPFPQGPQQVGGVVVQSLDERPNSPQAVFAVVNTLGVPYHAALFGLTPVGRIESDGRASQGSFLEAIAAQEIAQKTIQSNPALRGMSSQNEEIVGEGAMLAAMPQTYTRTLLRASNDLNQLATSENYPGITNQTIGSLQTTLDSQGYNRLDAETLLRGFNAYLKENEERFNGLPKDGDMRAPYQAAFEEYFKSAGIRDVGTFQQSLQTTLVNDFQTAGQQLIAAQVEQHRSQNQTGGDRAMNTAPGNPQFGMLYEQARAGLSEIGVERLGVNNDQTGIDNTAGVMANIAQRRQFENLAHVTENGGLVFGMRQDPNTQPGPYDYVTVDPKLASQVPLAQSTRDAQQIAQQEQQAQQIALQREPRTQGMG